jgi:hypothetical protein
LNPASKSLLSLSVGSLENTNRSNAGDQFTASNIFSNIKPEPAERRVLSSGSAVIGLIVRFIVVIGYSKSSGITVIDETESQPMGVFENVLVR